MSWSVPEIYNNSREEWTGSKEVRKGGMVNGK